jgi:hypothetical protein
MDILHIKLKGSLLVVNKLSWDEELVLARIPFAFFLSSLWSKK